jgi:uncharacterized glyoxalase superfamily protein PhnB
MTEPPHRDQFVPSAYYRDPRAALAWLEKAFGFELTMLIEGPDGDPRVMHSEMSIGGKGRIMIGGEWADWARSPVSIGGANSCNVHVYLDADIDAHCERARAAGAEITMEPSDQFYGDRSYRCKDPEGHVWSFAQPIRQVSREEAEQSIGARIFAPAWS